MRLYTRAFNNEKELETFVNENGIEMENIISIFETSSRDYMLVYYGE